MECEPNSSPVNLLPVVRQLIVSTGILLNIRKHTWVYWPYAFLFQAYNLPLCTVYIFIFTEVHCCHTGREMHDMIKDPDAEIQNSLCIQQLLFSQKQCYKL